MPLENGENLCRIIQRWDHIPALEGEELSRFLEHIVGCPGCAPHVDRLKLSRDAHGWGLESPPMGPEDQIMDPKVASLLGLLGWDPHAGSWAFDRYAEVKLIGHGGMGAVFTAKDTHLEKRLVAVKMPYGTLTHADSQRFLREVRLQAAIQHENIVQVYDADEYNGVPYLVMEYLEGTTLADRLANRPLPVNDILKIGTQIAAGLTAAHEHEHKDDQGKVYWGVLHRDLKPGNIFLKRGLRNEAHVKIIDFGLAKLVDQTTLLPGLRVAGTPAYMSPEQARGDPNLDLRSDLFSFGTILYEMCTGRSPFVGGGTEEIVAHVIAQPPDLSPLRSANIPQELIDLITQLHVKDRNYRLSSARDTWSRLELIGKGPPPPPPHPRPWRKIITLLLVAAALAFVALLILMAYNQLTRKDKDDVQVGSTNQDAPDIQPKKYRSELLTDNAWTEFRVGEGIMDKEPNLEKRQEAIPHFKNAITHAQDNIEAHERYAEGMEKELADSSVTIPKAGRVPNEISADERRRIHKNWAVNDISVCRFIVGRSNEYIVKLNRERRSVQSTAHPPQLDPEYSEDDKRRLSDAKEAYTKAAALSHGRCWDPDDPKKPDADKGQFWNPPEAASYRLADLKKLDDLKKLKLR